jgi:acyl-CoA synthetase (NDP forming)
MDSSERMTTPAVINPIIERARDEGRTNLTGVEAGELLGQVGVNVIATRLAVSCAGAVTAGRELGFPVVLKIASPDIVHKSDAGGVRLGLATSGQVERAYRETITAVEHSCPGARLLGVYVQPMAPPGTEVIIGMKRDAQFGPVLMFGLGGVWVELLQDVSLRVTPISRRDAAEMVREIRAYPLLAGYRGREPVDTACLEEMLLALDRLAQANPAIREIDLNPVIAGGSGAVAVDARVVLEDKAT